MAETDSSKRKEPEPDTAPAAEEKKEGATTPAAEKPAAAEPDAKRLKPTPPDAAAVRKQVEYYLCDENLRHDQFFHNKISSDKDGWLDINLILSCNKMKAMRATKEDVLTSLKDSKIEVREDGLCVRRPGNVALPTLEARPSHGKKNSLHAHDGGVIALIKEIPESHTWMQVKEKLKAAMPEKVSLWYVSEVNDKKQCIIAAAPFDGDQEFFEALELDLGGTKVKGEVAMGEPLQAALKLLPKNIRDKREKEARKRQKERNRPIVVGSMKFVNVAALRGRVKEIVNSRSEGERLKPDGTDFKLIKALLGFHPKGKEKSEGMVGIKVAKSSQGESRCFYMIKENGEEEDFSAKKCLDAVELNPPYMETEDKKAKAPAPANVAKAAPSAPASGEAAKEEKAADDAAGKEPAAA